ncbi:hypothetical protein ANANG_G00256600 [Anguilla anguilla]|uniref:Uncharacterized protein n=1 Tax=Anguilla anguilla TaxID=7936 RepID=A0A9D3M172_ANGAN|nr:hypothetical protein ANANG_G00256600 [Anguilla anguilla]
MAGSAGHRPDYLHLDCQRGNSQLDIALAQSHVAPKDLRPYSAPLMFAPALQNRYLDRTPLSAQTASAPEVLAAVRVACEE